MSGDASRPAEASSRPTDASRLGDAARLWLFAREDALDAVREREAYVLVGFFVLLAGGMAYLAGRTVTDAPPGTDLEVELAGTLLFPLVYLVPLTALAFVAPALVQQRTSGALTVLLGLPFSRRTVVLGTLVGRSAVVAASTLAAMLVGLAIGLVMGVPIDAVAFVVAVLSLLGLTVLFGAIGVAISASTRTSTRATFGAFAAYVICVFGLWRYLPRIALYLANGLEFPDSTPEWVPFVAALNPMTAFTNALTGVSRPLADSTLASPPTDPAFYERPAFAAAVLVAWVVASVAFALHRFRAADL